MLIEYIPPILEICSKVNSIRQDATGFCYPNPITAIATTVTRKYPDMKFIGMCHEMASLERYLLSIMQADFSNLKLRPAGLNHFSIPLEEFYRDTGKDAYSYYQRKRTCIPSKGNQDTVIYGTIQEKREKSQGLKALSDDSDSELGDKKKTSRE